MKRYWCWTVAASVVVMEPPLPVPEQFFSHHWPWLTLVACWHILSGAWQLSLNKHLISAHDGDISPHKMKAFQCREEQAANSVSSLYSQLHDIVYFQSRFCALQGYHLAWNLCNFFSDFSISNFASIIMLPLTYYQLYKVTLIYIVRHNFRLF